MKKTLLIIFFSVVIYGLVSADTRHIDLPEILKPDSIFVKDKHLYIIEGDICRMFTLPEGKSAGSFGKSGEGPGELKIMPGLSAGISDSGNETLVLEGMNKILFFTREGNLIEEKRKKGRFFRTNILGKNYAALGITVDQKSGKGFLTLSIFDTGFNLIKELYKQEMKDNDKDIEMVTDTIIYSVWKGRIYLADNRGQNSIIVFNSDGREMYRFNTGIAGEQIDQEFREKEILRLQQDDFISMMIKREGGWDNFRKRMNFIFPDSLPPVQGLTVTDDRIHILTYSRRDNREKFIISDLRGNGARAVFLPVPMKSSFLSKTLGRENRFYSFSAGNYHYLSEHEGSECFRINTIPLSD